MNPIDQLKEAMEKGVAELNPDDMDKVSGGVMTHKEKSTLRYFLRMAKKENKMSMGEVLALVPQLFPIYSKQYPNVTEKDITDYIKAVYPSL